jgi:hypothetical protein
MNAIDDTFICSRNSQIFAYSKIKNRQAKGRTTRRKSREASTAYARRSASHCAFV